MYTTHFLFPEQRWGVFKDNQFVKSFETLEDAETWISVQEQK
jgi:hypothetical protein